jgi:hypothetical protein
MDFIELIFHVSPDRGNGTLESLFISSVVLSAVFIVSRRWMFRSRRAREAAKTACAAQ